MMNEISADSPFSLDNDAAYHYWRSNKLLHHPVVADELIVPIKNPHSLTDKETNLLQEKIKSCNMVIYSIEDSSDHDKSVLTDIGEHFGLEHLDNNLHADEDAISSLSISEKSNKKSYIPYTNKPIAWHTDGYYNTGHQQIRAMQLHCVKPAKEGGSNRLLDHEIAYLMLRDQNPDYIKVLSGNNVMSIPANISEGKEIRPAVTGPVFSTDAQGNLHMRYTARTRSINWLDDPLVLEAKEALLSILKSNSLYHFEVTLKAGQGILCNNVLHTRTPFEENSDRLLYRGRYFDRIKTKKL